jgi:hypothetical protein
MLSYGFHCTCFHETHKHSKKSGVAPVTKLFPDWVKSLENMGRVLFMLLNEEWFFTAPVFTRLTHAVQSFVKNSYTEFNESPRNGVVDDTWSWTDRKMHKQGFHIRHLFLHLIQNV